MVYSWLLVLRFIALSLEHCLRNAMLIGLCGLTIYFTYSDRLSDVRLSNVDLFRDSDSIYKFSLFSIVSRSFNAWTWDLNWNLIGFLDRLFLSSTSMMIFLRF